MNTFIHNIIEPILQTYETITELEYVGGAIAIVLQVVFLLVLAKVAIRLLRGFIRRIFASKKHFGIGTEDARVKTLEGLLHSIVRYIVYFVVGTSILSSFGVQVGALLATAGVGGLAIGFGAQNLVRDIITGFFILFENQFTVGDYVEIEGAGGIVEEMGLRVTKVRDFTGDLHIMPNGAISKVINKSSGKMWAWVNMPIAYEEDIDRAIRVLEEASEELAKTNGDIVEGPEVLGVNELADSGVLIATLAYAAPMTQWSVARAMRKAYKQAFDREGIEIPYPRRVVIMANGEKEEVEENAYAAKSGRSGNA
ncbi:mechanosensitive ion channel family protein [Tindallia californiensis]|uniref:Small conductance mechanosensitive channel n=1 Tax=Tindallia californiensis TaxID=159292 RepID=A0A1H3Q2D7_9FIRM|nr:mechanosensitive ion channel family protein [Tindallia californiensis]SDZ07664.1 small conductance mechanosensitive channel [Tindallia californiensis]